MQLPSDDFLLACAKIGADFSLNQGAGGNASEKYHDVLWVKASGRSLADVFREEVFVPIPLVGDIENCEGDNSIRPSIEYKLHQIIPSRYVFHYHSINCVYWASQVNRRSLLDRKLSRHGYRFLEYACPGDELASILAKEIGRKAVSSPDLFLLENHGAIVCGSDLDEIWNLIRAVELSLASDKANAWPKKKIAQDLYIPLGYRRPAFSIIEVLAHRTDIVDILRDGYIVPDQVVFSVNLVCVSTLPRDFSDISSPTVEPESTALIVRGAGVLLSSAVSYAAECQLAFMVELASRYNSKSEINYLTHSQVTAIRENEGERYRRTLIR